MSRYRILLLFVTTVLVFSGNERTTLAQEGHIAILVVDIFENSAISSASAESGEEEGNCFVPIDGQDSYTWGGGGGGNVGPELTVFSDPHGRLVYRHMQRLFAETQTTLQDKFSTDGSFPPIDDFLGTGRNYSLDSRH